MRIFRWAIFLGAVICSSPTYAARCGGDFNTFVAAMSQEAAAAGVSQAVISQAFAGITQDPAVLAFDRRQRGTFTKTFEQYVSTRVGPGRINIGRQMLQRHGSLLSRIEQRFGVPPGPLLAIWGMETGFGSQRGNQNMLSSIATLAYDCRRSEYFTEHLYAALQLIDRGALSPAQRGSMHGEVGQTQFMPKAILAYGTGNLENAANALSSTANFLKAHGWRAGAGYQPGEPNFAAIQAWNAAGVYQKAIALMGRQIDGGE